MFRDLRDEAVPSELQYDLCIVGAGAAGISLAREFVGTRTRVCVVESGASSFEAETQNLYKGDVVGVRYEALDICRLRFFGGTTNHWAGYCSPFPDYSFERHDWIPHSGWPIRGSDVREYYERTHSLLGMEPTGWDPVEGWDVGVLSKILRDPSIPLDQRAFKDKAYVIKAVRMGAMFRDALGAAENIDIFLNANVVNISTVESASTVTGLDVRTLSGRRGTFRARYYVLAAGGIENARLLLSSNSVQPEGLGNQHDLVGRFFSDHFEINAGSLQPDSNQGVNIGLYERRSIGESEIYIWQELTFDALKEFGLVPAAVRMDAVRPTSTGLRSLSTLARAARAGGLPYDLGTHVGNVMSDITRITDFAADWLWHGEMPVDRIGVQILLDPAPNRDSRVTLGEETDALGLRRVRLDWRLSEIDVRTVRWMTDRVAAGAAAKGLGRMKVEFDETDISSAVIQNRHHIGTTRMADDPAEGVVDRDCKVHGIDNLYVAGSSVFSTCGWGSPTMLIVALALRLADHLKLKGVA